MNLKKKLSVAFAAFFLLIPTAKALIFLYPIAVATSTPITNALLISGLAHGAAIAFIRISRTDQGGNEVSKPINVQLSPSAPLTTPEGWQDAETPPQTTAATTNQPLYTVGSGITGASIEAVQQAAIATYPATVNGNPRTYLPGPVSYISQSPSSWTLGNSAGSFQVHVYQDGAFIGSTNSTVQYANNSETQCPEGYTNQSGDCQLSQPETVQKPPKDVDEFKRDGNNFQRDPRQDPQDNAPQIVQPSPNQIQYTDNETGEQVTITLNSDGSATVEQATPNYANGTTTIKTTQVSAPSGGGGSPSVTGQATNTYSGTGTAIGNTPITGGSSGGTNGNFTCPECATEVTLSNIKQILEGENSGAETAGQSFGASFNAAQDATYDGNLSQMQNMVNNSGLLQAYQERLLPISPWHLATQEGESSCTFAFELFNRVYNISICDAQPFLHTALNFGFFILLAFGIINLLAERPEGNA